MSPAKCANPASAAVTAALARLFADYGIRIREVRLQRRLTCLELARRAGVSRTSIYTIERGSPVSPDVAVRVTTALGLRLEIDLVDARRRQASFPARAGDPVHGAMGDFEAAHLRGLGFPTGLDEPYQHYQFAGRADVVAWDLEHCALLHIENRTRFPNLQETGGSYNSKRAYLGAALAERLGVSAWASETHAIVALWSAEVLHVLRLRTASFRALCPDSAQAFAGWWRGEPPARGRSSALVVLDPLAHGRERTYIDIDAALVSRPRYHGYADAAAALLAGRRPDPA